ncbi:hypothetical protein [Pseudoneobacillus sp. C159]
MKENNSSPFDYQWKELQKFKPTPFEKATTRTRLEKTILNPKVSKKTSYWQSILATGLLFFILGSFLWALLENSQQQIAGQPEEIIKVISWDLPDTEVRKAENDGWAIFRKNKPLQVGAINKVTLTEKNTIAATSAMFVEENLENFPYPTQMYIEHKKMENVALRYHFFIPLMDETWLHFTFDYNQLEFAEIFQAMATLNIKGKNPIKHQGQLYVKHGYGTLPYPVGIKPISINPHKEIYLWERGAPDIISEYYKKIQEHYELVSTTTNSRTFISADGIQEVTITIKNKELTYDFVYHHQED